MPSSGWTWITSQLARITSASVCSNSDIGARLNLIATSVVRRVIYLPVRR